MSSISELLPDAADIRDASQEGENTAVRVGTLFADMINAVDAEFDAANETLSNHTTTLASHTSSLTSLDTKIGRAYNEAFFFGIPAITTGSGGATLTLTEKTGNRQNYFSLNNSSSPSKKSFNVKGTVTATAFNSDDNTLMGSTCYLYLDITDLATQPESEPDNGIYYTANDTKVWVKGLKFKPAYNFSQLESNQYFVGVVRFYYSRSGALIDTEGVIRLNATSYTIDGVTYNNRYPMAIGEAVTTVQGATTSLESTVGGIGKLRVLHIGNSFGQDALSYIGDIIAADGTKIPAADLYIGSLLKGGSTLSDWATWIDANAKRSESGSGSGPSWDVAHGGASAASDITCASDDYMKNYIAQPWDVIVVQQLSQNNTSAEGFADLAGLVATLRELCPNAAVRIGLQVAWSYGGNEATMYANISNAARQAAGRYDVDFVIPTGTAVENARVAFSGQYSNNLTRDGQHIGFGVGRYVVGSAWWEAVIKPWCGMSILGNTLTKTAASDTSYTSSASDSLDVTGSNRHLAQWCAVAAQENKWAAVAAAEVPTYTAADKTAIDAAHTQAPLSERMLEAERNIERDREQLAGSIATNAAAIAAREWKLVEESGSKVSWFRLLRASTTTPEVKRWKVSWAAKGSDNAVRISDEVIEAQTILDLIADGTISEWSIEETSTAGVYRKEKRYLIEKMLPTGQNLQLTVIARYTNVEQDGTLKATSELWMSHLLVVGNSSSVYYAIYTQSI